MIEVDDGEPLELVRLLDQGIDLDIKDMNGRGYADYRWSGRDGYTSLERERVDNLISSLDEIEVKVRERVKRFPTDRHVFLVEGVVEPAPQGVVLYHRRQGQNVFLGSPAGPRRPGAYKRLMGWWYRAAEYIEVYPTSSMAGSAVAIAEFYSIDNREEESTIFKRHVKPMNFHANKQVERLMGLAGTDTGLGVARCEALIARYGTVWGVAKRSPEELAIVAGIGRQTAETFLRRIGRPDV